MKRSSMKVLYILILIALMLVSVAYAAVINTDVSNTISKFAGKVGIGIENPLLALEVDGSTNITENLYVMNISRFYNTVYLHNNTVVTNNITANGLCNTTTCETMSDLLYLVPMFVILETNLNNNWTYTLAIRTDVTTNQNDIDTINATIVGNESVRVTALETNLNNNWTYILNVNTTQNIMDLSFYNKSESDNNYWSVNGDDNLTGNYIGNYNINTTGNITVLNYWNGTSWISASLLGRGTGGGSSNASGVALERTITQTAHPFTAGQVAYYNGTHYLLAKADSADTLGMFIVSENISVNSFKIISSGYINTMIGLVGGTFYFTSEIVAGSLTSIESAIYSNPMLLALSATEGYVLPWRASSTNSTSTWSDPVDSNIVPDTNVTYNLGSSTNMFNRTYTNEICLNKACTFRIYSNSTAIIINASV